MNTLKRYFIATRPWSFPVSVTSVLLPMMYLWATQENVHVGLGLWAILGIILFHTAGNLFSDYWDYKQGVDQEAKAGGSAITHGIINAKEVIVFASIMLAIAVINGLVMLLFTGWQLLIFGGLGALLVLAYPWMKFHALGDLDILLSFGVVPTLGTAFVMTGEVMWSALWITPMFVTITMGVLHANNTRDALLDSHADIRTFAMVIGPKASQVVYYIEEWLPLAWTVVCVLCGQFHWILIITSALASIVAFRNTKVMASGQINMLDQMTAQHQIANMLMMTIGFIGMMML